MLLPCATIHGMKHALKTFPVQSSLTPFAVHAVQPELRIDLGERSYSILIGANILNAVTTWSSVPQAAQALIVSNTTVAPLYAASLQQALAGQFDKVHCLELPDGEAYKTWASLIRIFDALLGQQCDRKTVSFALGGGVVGDVTGFSAAY